MKYFSITDDQPSRKIYTVLLKITDMNTQYPTEILIVPGLQFYWGALF